MMYEPAMGSLFVFFVTSILLIVAAYYITRLIGRRAARLVRGKNVALLEKNVLPGSISIQVVKCGTYVYILATQGKEMIQLDRLSLEEWEAMRAHSAEETEGLPRNAFLEAWKEQDLPGARWLTRKMEKRSAEEGERNR